MSLIDVFIFIDMSHKEKVGLMWVFYSLTPHCALWFLTQMLNDGNQPWAILLLWKEHYWRSTNIIVMSGNTTDPVCAMWDCSFLTHMSTCSYITELIMLRAVTWTKCVCLRWFLDPATLLFHNPFSLNRFGCGWRWLTVFFFTHLYCSYAWLPCPHRCTQRAGG